MSVGFGKIEISRKETPMSKFEITTTVVYVFEVEAETLADAEAMGWDYEDYPYGAEVDSIEVYEYPEEDETND
jgi:hypothetical protein